MNNQKLTTQNHTEPTPAEEAAARAKEAEEQNALPYKWQQTIADVDVTFSVPGNYKSKDLVIDLKKNTIYAGVKGQDPIIKVCIIQREAHHHCRGQGN